MTTASKITLVRVFMIPLVMIAMYLSKGVSGLGMWISLGLFVIASVTDFIDGQIARKCNQVSDFGKFLDPLADKLLTIAVMTMFCEWGRFPAWALMIVLTREFAVTGLRLVAVILGAPSSKDRFEAAAALLDYGFGGWQAAPLPAPEVQPLQLKVKGSAEDSVPLDYSALPQTVLLPREGTAELTAQASLPQQLEAPVEKGQTVGTVQVYHGETLLGEYEVKAAADAPRMDFGTAFSLLWGSLTG